MDRNETRHGTAARILTIFLFLLLAVAAAAQGSSGKLQAGDTVRIVAEGRTALNQLQTLDDQGRVTLPQVGAVTLAGLSIRDAEQALGRRLRIFDPELESVRLTRTDSHPVSIQVQGAVQDPGTFSYEESPTLWDLVQSAGGLTETADLPVARVVREERGSARILPLDLSSLVTGGRIPEFMFVDGDVLVVPTTESGGTPVPTSNGVQVFGAVADPAVIALTAPRPLLDVLMLAGSPLADAKLDEIRLVHPVDGRFAAQLVDLNLFMEEGDPTGNPLVYPGDALQVGFRNEGWFRRNSPMILSSLTAVTTIWLAYDRITED